jgi:zinc-ribbon domain
MSTVVDPDTQHAAPTAEKLPPAAHAPETVSCPNCGAPAGEGQLMCLECGSRLALGYQRPPSWRLPAAVIGVVLLIAAIGVAIALAGVTGNANKTTAAPPTSQAAPSQAAPADTPPTASTPAPAPTTSTATPAPTDSGATGGSATPTPAPAPSDTGSEGWPPGKSAFTVVLASMTTKAEAEDKLTKAKAAGISTAAILQSDDFPTLNPGYWVVFDGQYDSVDQAQTQAASDRGKGEFSDAYPRFVSKDANAKP